MITEDFAAYAARLSVRFPAAVPPEKAQQMLESFMSGVSMDCLEAGTRLIGHIKCVVEVGSSFITCSVTDHDARVRCKGRFEQPLDSVEVIVNVLQYGLAKKELVRITAECARRTFQGSSALGIEDLEIEQKDLIQLG